MNYKYIFSLEILSYLILLTSFISCTQNIEKIKSIDDSTKTNQIKCVEEEICGDSIDNNCDETIDENCDISYDEPPSDKPISTITIPDVPLYKTVEATFAPSQKSLAYFRSLDWLYPYPITIITPNGNIQVTAFWHQPHVKKDGGQGRGYYYAPQNSTDVGVWMVRFTPTKLGKHIIILPAPNSSQEFNVFTPSTSQYGKGFIHRGTGNKGHIYYFDNGEIYYPMGFTQSWSSKFTTLTDPLAVFYWGKGQGLEGFSIYFDQMKTYGGNFNRWWLGNGGSWECNNGEENNFGTNIFFSHESFLSPQLHYCRNDNPRQADFAVIEAFLQESLNAGVYNQMNINLDNNYWLSDSNNEAYAKKIYRYTVARLSHYPAVFNWEVKNEDAHHEAWLFNLKKRGICSSCDSGNSDDAWQIDYLFHHEMFNIIRSKDIYRDLVTTSYSGEPFKGYNSLDQDYIAAIMYEADAFQLHHYIQHESLWKPLEEIGISGTECADAVSDPTKRNCYDPVTHSEVAPDLNRFYVLNGGRSIAGMVKRDMDLAKWTMGHPSTGVARPNLPVISTLELFPMWYGEFGLQTKNSGMESILPQAYGAKKCKGNYQLLSLDCEDGPPINQVEPPLNTPWDSNGNWVAEYFWGNFVFANSASGLWWWRWEAPWWNRLKELKLFIDSLKASNDLEDFLTGTPFYGEVNGIINTIPYSEIFGRIGSKNAYVIIFNQTKEFRVAYLGKPNPAGTPQIISGQVYVPTFGTTTFTNIDLYKISKIPKGFNNQVLPPKPPQYTIDSELYAFDCGGYNNGGLGGTVWAKLPSYDGQKGYVNGSNADISFLENYSGCGSNPILDKNDNALSGIEKSLYDTVLMLKGLREKIKVGDNISNPNDITSIYGYGKMLDKMIFKVASQGKYLVEIHNVSRPAVNNQGGGYKIYAQKKFASYIDLRSGDQSCHTKVDNVIVDVGASDQNTITMELLPSGGFIQCSAIRVFKLK